MTSPNKVKNGKEQNTVNLSQYKIDDRSNEEIDA